MNWTRTHTLIAGIALIIVTNAVALGGAYCNRMGEPDSTLHLSQRELHLSESWWDNHENNGIVLKIRWRTLGAKVQDSSDSYPSYYDDNYGYNPPAWLDQAKLAELGFDVSKPTDTDQGRRHYGKMLPRDAVLVLELNGPSYQEALKRAKDRLARAEQLLADHPGDKEFENRAKMARQHAEREEPRFSRLFVVDAGLEQRALRAKYPDRAKYLILKGRIRLSIGSRRGKDDHVTGYVGGVSVEQISVPLQYRALFESILRTRRPYSDEDWKSPYEVTVAFGKRLEPWIVEVTGGVTAK